MADIYKFGHLVTPTPQPVFEPHVYGNLWMRQKVGDVERLALAPDQGACRLITALTRRLDEPFGLLYIVLYPHFGHKRGRYQSKQPLSRVQTEKFFRDYAEFFELDGRHNIWVVSMDKQFNTLAQIIYDHHNIIYAYGPLDAFAAAAAAHGLTEGPIVVPRDHRHQFSEQFNRDESNLIDEREWLVFPTQESDY
jgi:hypothetical protein